jgi:hypothetical protein
MPPVISTIQIRQPKAGHAAGAQSPSSSVAGPGEIREFHADRGSK